MADNGGGCASVAAVILAAGAATRMGRLKQLLPYQGKPLVQIAIENARSAGFRPIVVVVGAEAAAVRAAIAALPVEVVENSKWRAGMGSSVVAGMNHLRQSGVESFGVALLLADQPLVRPDHLLQMRSLLLSGTTAIVAAKYNETLGVPALFKRQLFGRLASLPPDAGARYLIRDANLPVGELELPEAAMDIDTPEDFAALSKSGD